MVHFLQGAVCLFHRSWTGHPCYRLKLAPATQGTQVSEAAFVISDRTLDFSCQAARLDFLISNLLLGEDNPALFLLRWKTIRPQLPTCGFRDRLPNRSRERAETVLAFLVNTDIEFVGVDTL
jgi:hypothetical protein